MGENLIATAFTTVDAPREKVWQAMVDPAAIKEYMFGSTVVTDWQVGSPILWQGEWEGKPFEDRGKILQIKPGQVLKYSHFSPLSGAPEVPENYHIITMELADAGGQTRVTLKQDGNPSEEERQHSEQNWTMMLESLKKYLEG